MNLCKYLENKSERLTDLRFSYPLTEVDGC